MGGHFTLSEDILWRHLIDLNVFYDHMIFCNMVILDGKNCTQFHLYFKYLVRYFWWLVYNILLAMVHIYGYFWRKINLSQTYWVRSLYCYTPYLIWYTSFEILFFPHYLIPPPFRPLFTLDVTSEGLQHVHLVPSTMVSIVYVALIVMGKLMILNKQVLN